MKASELLKCLKPALSRFLIKNYYFASYGSFAYKYLSSISGYWFIGLNNEFVFPDPESPIITILYGWSSICGEFVTFNFFFFTD